MIAFEIMLILAGIIVLIAAAAQAGQNRSFAACSETTIGTVTRKRSRNVKNGKSHELTVSYTVDGTPYEKVVGALLSEFESIAEGDNIELRYKPDNPRKAVRPEQLNPKNVRIVLIVGAVLLVLGVVLFFIGHM